MKKHENLPYDNILLVDTSERDTVEICLLQQNRQPTIESCPVRSQDLPKIIEKFLIENKVSLAEIGALAVLKTTGSLTGNRVGASSINALGWITNKPILEITGRSISEVLKDANLQKSFKKVEHTLPIEPGIA